MFPPEQLRGEVQYMRQQQPTENWADMVTPADFVTLQQQLRQEVADAIQQLRAEMSETISSRMDMMNSISAAI